MTHWIAGEWVQGQGEAFTSLSPYNQEVIWQGNGATAEQVNQDRKSTRLNSSHTDISRMPSSA